MRVNLGRGDMAMAEELLDRADIVAVFKKLRRETVSQRVGGSMLRDLRPLNCFLYGLLNYRLVDVVSPLHVGDPVKIPAAGRKHELPSPLRIRVGILAGDRIRQCRATGALAQVLFVNTLRVLQVLEKDGIFGSDPNYRRAGPTCLGTGMEARLARIPSVGIGRRMATGHRTERHSLHFRSEGLGGSANYRPIRI